MVFCNNIYMENRVCLCNMFEKGRKTRKTRKTRSLPAHVDRRDANLLQVKDLRVAESLLICSILPADLLEGADRSMSGGPNAGSNKGIRY